MEEQNDDHQKRKSMQHRLLVRCYEAYCIGTGGVLCDKKEGEAGGGGVEVRERATAAEED